MGKNIWKQQKKKVHLLLRDTIFVDSHSFSLVVA